MSLWGGFAVIPQRYIASIKKASAVRKMEPMLLRLLTLSSKIIIGAFVACLNSSTVFLPSSSFFNFLIAIYFCKYIEL